MALVTEQNQETSIVVFGLYKRMVLYVCILLIQTLMRLEMEKIRCLT